MTIFILNSQCGFRNNLEIKDALTDFSNILNNKHDKKGILFYQQKNIIIEIERIRF